MDGKPPSAGDDDFLRPFDVQVIPEGALTADALKDARVVALANCGGLQPPQFEMLRTFVAGGGGLLIFPGDRVNPKVYDEQFFPVPGPQGERLTAARLEAAEGDPDKSETSSSWARSTSPTCTRSGGAPQPRPDDAAINLIPYLQTLQNCHAGEEGQRLGAGMVRQRFAGACGK